MGFIEKIFISLKNKLSAINLIGKSVTIGSDVQITGCRIQGKVIVGDYCKLNQVNINGEVEIGNHSSLWGPNIFMNSVLNKIEIGKYCSIAKNVIFQEYNHNYHQFTTYFYRQNIIKSGTFEEEVTSKGPIVIEHDVWIGAGSIILGGAYISTGAVIAANSVVNGFVPPYAIVGGTPARVIKYRFDQSIIQALIDSKWWDWDMEIFKEKYGELEKLVKG